MRYYVHNIIKGERYERHVHNIKGERLMRKYIFIYTQYVIMPDMICTLYGGDICIYNRVTKTNFKKSKIKNNMTLYISFG